MKDNKTCSVSVVADSIKQSAARKVYKSEYDTWVSMRQRCYNKNHPEFFRYGKVGVGVSEEWLTSFDNFLSDMGVKYCANFSLDRIDSSLGYSKSNCRWASKSTQSFNQKVSIDNKSGLTGVQYRDKFNTYRAYITVKGKRVHLGSASNLFDACCLRKTAEIKYYGNKREIK
jgi:hypothetical protein